MQEAHVFDAGDHPLTVVIDHIEAQHAAGASSIPLDVLDPDSPSGANRPFAVWVDLAGRLRMRLQTPVRRPDGRVRLTFVPVVDVPRVSCDDPRERYGTHSWFAAIDKRDDPVFVLDLRDALRRAQLPERPKLLFLGMNRGDEIALVLDLLGRPADVWGLDHSPSAVALAQSRFPDAHLHEADLSTLADLAIPPVDFVVAIDVLHSPQVDDQAVLRDVLAVLAPGGAVCIGVPNCTYVGGERLPGARTRNLTEPDLSLMVKKVGHYRRTLHRRGFRVFVSGVHEILVTAVRPPRIASDQPAVLP